MAEGSNTPDVRSARLAPMTYEEVKASAQRVFDLRGRPPYTAVNYNVGGGPCGEDQIVLSDDELRVLSEFIQFWLPFLVEKEKKS